jgi:muconolactone delta-isomerase
LWRRVDIVASFAGDLTYSRRLRRLDGISRAVASRYRAGSESIRATAEQPNYGTKLERDGKLECRYRLIGKHGGASIYNVKSNEELDLLSAMVPVYNYAHYEVLPLADMANPDTVFGKS